MAEEKKRRRKGAVNGTSKLVTLQGASDEYGLPYTSLRDLVLGGHLPAVRPGDSRRYWVRRADLEKLFTPTSEGR